MSLFEVAARGHKMKRNSTLVEFETRGTLWVPTTHTGNMRQHFLFRHVNNSSNL